MGRIGETLKKARELREIDLREISDATKINIRYLEAIETNHFDLLPGGVFNKGFIRAYANYIGLDGQAMVDNYVHDLESDANNATAVEPAPSGLHRPSAIPLRRATPVNSGGAESGTKSPSHPAPLHLTALQEVSSDPMDDSPAAGERGVLPRIAWLMVATGLLFVILASWKYLRDPPPSPDEAQQAESAQPPSTDHAVSTALPATDSAVTATSEDEAPAGDSGVMMAAPQTVPPASANDSGSVPQPARQSAASGHAEHASPQDSPTADGTATGTTPEPTSPADSAPSAIPPPARESPPAGNDDRGMTMVITARAATRVRVICDGREAADREMRRGEVQSLHCERLIRLSAPDAAGIRLTINGSPCQPLGAPGSRLFGYVIRTDDYRSICPDPKERPDAAR